MKENDVCILDQDPRDCRYKRACRYWSIRGDRCVYANVKRQEKAARTKEAADGSTVVQSDAAGFVDKEPQNPAGGFRMKLNKDQLDTFRFTEWFSDCENLPSDPLRTGLHGWSD